MEKGGKETVVTAVVVMTEKPAGVVVTVLFKPTLKKKRRLQKVGTKRVVTAVVVVTKKPAGVVVTVLFKPTLKMRLIMVDLALTKIGPLMQVKS